MSPSAHDNSGNKDSTSHSTLAIEQMRQQREKVSVKAQQIMNSLWDLKEASFDGHVQIFELQDFLGRVKDRIPNEQTGSYEFGDYSVIDHVSNLVNDSSVATVLIVINAKRQSLDVYKVATPGSSGCFIATAAYGSALAPEVLLLSEFRDDYLMKSNFGRALVLLYYSISPRSAEFIASRPALRALTRNLLLKPVIGSLRGLQSHEH